MKQPAYSQLTTWQEFLKAGLQSEYQSLYSELCMIGRSLLDKNSVALKATKDAVRRVSEVTYAFDFFIGYARREQDNQVSED